VIAANTKHELRKTGIRSRRQLQGDALDLARRLVFERAHKLRVFQLARYVHVYMALSDEVPTWPFAEYAFALGKRVVVPVVVPGSVHLHHVEITPSTVFTEGAYGIQEPVLDSSSVSILPSELTGEHSCVLVPISAFDPENNRLGYGKGYYDAFLSQTTAPSIGLAFECQKVPHIPIEPHDVPLTMIVTEQKVYGNHR
jgi:5-formyltetrahydrofolate cyclo-ligase